MRNIWPTQCVFYFPLEVIKGITLHAFFSKHNCIENVFRIIVLFLTRILTRLCGISRSAGISKQITILPGI